MKLLRNPIVVSALALTAIVLVVYQFVPHRRGGSTARRRAAVASSPGSAAVPGSDREMAKTFLPHSEAETTAGPLLEMAAIEPKIFGWLETPRHDPFKVRFLAEPGVKTPPAAELLTLSAVWLQDQQSLAVINKIIRRAGDPILSFTIKSIQSGGVWVTGPNGDEFVTFKIAGFAPEPDVAPILPASSTVSAAIKIAPAKTVR